MISSLTPCLLLLFVSMLFNVGLGSSPDCVTWIEDGICLKGDYRKFQRPSPKTDIEVTFLVNEVLNVDDEAQTMTVATVTIYSWLDSRIEIEDSIGNDTEVHVEYQLLQHLWTPDIFFFNLIDFKEMAALDKLSGITIKGSGHVELFSKSIQTVSCSMGFNDFPFDTQTCQLYITSSVHPADEMEFSTELVPNEKLKDDLEKVTVTMEAIPEKDRVVLDALEQEHNFSRAGIVFTLERKASSYIMRYYVPTFGMVFVSFVSFLIPPDAIPGRTGLLVTLFLVLTTIFGNIQSSTPTSEGLTALSSYVLACLLFVFSAKLEFALVLFVKRNYSRNEKKSHQRINMGQPSPGSTTDKLAPSSSSSSSGKWQLEELENVAAAEENKKGKNDLMGCCSMFERINDVDEFCYQTDKIAFCIFSFVFCLYNLAYTIVYST